MPDSSRPISSRFFEVSKSFLTFDNSAKRVANHPGGKNLSIIFAYLTSKVFEKILLSKIKSEKTGKEAFMQSEDGWVSSQAFLIYMEWKLNTLTEKIIVDIFNSFVQDKVMKSRVGKGFEFYYLQDLDFPTDEQISEARKTNTFLMNIVDDLVDFIPRTLETGEPAHNRNTKFYAPLWEAFYADPFHEAYKEEMLIQVREFIDNFELIGNLSIVQIGTGVGFGSLEIMDILAEKLHSMEISILYLEEITHLLSKAQEQLTHYLSDKIRLYNSKSISVRPNFDPQSFKALTNVQNNSVNFVFAFHVLQFVKTRELETFFEQVSRVLRLDGIFVLTQPTSYSREFPYPLTLLYHGVVNFHGYPTADDVKKIARKYFDRIQVSAMDTLWILKFPKFN